MMVGCYSLHLYCDTAGCPNSTAKPSNMPAGASPPAEFTHQTNEAGAFREARKAGWKLNSKDWTCYCPQCVKAGKAP
jgi:hypothetical protein